MPLIFVAAAASEARAGLIIDPTFNANMNAQQQAAVNYVIGEYEHLYTNNITLNISFQMGVTGLGESNSTVEGSFTYAQIKAALSCRSRGPPGGLDQADGGGQLAGNQPGADKQLLAHNSRRKALGLDNYGGSDGMVTFSNAVSYTYDPNNRGVAGEYDFIGVAEHEISEVMGRIPGLGSNYGNGASYDLNDLYRFTNGVRNFTVDQSDPPGVYLSINGGGTNMVNFYSQGDDNDDYRGDNPTDPYNQFAGQGQAHALTNADMINMDALGYNLAQATPEPASLTLLATGCFAFGGLRAVRRRRRTVA